ncbi:calmodulin-binding protein [Nonomuraea sp. NEAU-A123]|uniref:BP74-related protein n=1 Tax=Nonomuraea sp. NEAU-A123 TaxID=2839649 RepID=UPI001BE3E1D1|nr:calmodulin-binding protein [Nonomuraea sp. NEAU-A123]MBT2231260.1 calmodulin-binding protein [Nonomuraea sp. NEAU-A123]
MYGILTKIATALAAIVVLGFAAPAPAQAAAPAYFEFADITGERFVVQLTDAAKIQHARNLLSGTTTDEPHIMGRIVKRPAPYNRPWSYYLHPGTVDFFSDAFEICDATIPYVEEHLDEAGGPFLPGLIWCPWTSRLVRELP